MEDDWRKRLEEVVRDDRRSLRAISQEAGYGENYVQQMLKDKKQPTFPRLARVLSVLGSSATVYVTTGIAIAPEAQLRSALIAYGVDKDEVSQVMDIITTFVRAERPEETPSPGQIPSASPLREKVRSK